MTLGMGAAGALRSLQAGLAGCAGLCLLAAPALAAQTEEALFSVMARQGCQVGPHEVADLFGPEGFTPDFVRETLTGLLVDGTATEDARGDLSVPATLCPPEEARPTPKDTVLRAFAENDCTLDDTTPGALESRFDLSRAQLQAIVEPLYEAGDLTVVGREARLSDTLCQAAADDA